MQLSDIQSALGITLLQPEGLDALKNKSAWDTFCRENDYITLQVLPHERLRLYEELLFNSVESTLSSLFPFCKRFFKDDAWYRLVEVYRREYPNTSYQLYRLAEGFQTFIKNQETVLQAYPFLAELAEYEWQEAVLLNAATPKLPDTLKPHLPETLEDLQETAPFWNPVSSLQVFQYPIPGIISNIQTLDKIPNALPVERQPTDILMYRTSENFKVRFFQLNALTTALFESSQQTVSYLELFKTLHQTVPALADIPEDTVLLEGLKLLAQCFDESLLLGSVPV